MVRNPDIGNADSKQAELSGAHHAAYRPFFTCVIPVLGCSVTTGRYFGIMMPPYFVAFLDVLKKREHNVEYWQFTSDETCPKLTLAARHPCVGPLVLYDEGNELTLEFGTKYHCHFHGSEAIARKADRMIEASRLAANFVDRILHERIGVAVYFNDRGCTGASLIYLDELGLTTETLASSDAKIYGGLIRTERFLWTGPVTNPT